MHPCRLLAALASLTLPPLAPAAAPAEIHTGSGAFAGEITDRSAIVLVRLTATPGQNAQGLIPGRSGQARLRYGTDESLRQFGITGWQQALPENDHAIQFHLDGLRPATRHFYRVDYRADEQSAAKTSERFSFLTAPAPGERAPVFFHHTTCQDLHGAPTYTHMTAQQPDFCVSNGDTVYYDGQCLARNVPQAFQAYQKMFGLPGMKDYYRDTGGYFMKDDHDYRFNDADPHMKGKWVSAKEKDPLARYTETKGNEKLDTAWLTHEEGVRVFRQVFPASEKPYRTFRWGKGVQIWLTETREFRSPNAMPDGPEKTAWGKEQKEWLMRTLLESDADWRIILSPNAIVGPDRLMKGDGHANLNGFWHEGQEFLDWLKDHKLANVVLTNGDRHWQYHSVDRRNGREIHEFSCGPTSDLHTQAVPPLYEGVERPYAKSCGGFLSIRYRPEDRSLAFVFHSQEGKPLYQKSFP